MSLTWVCVYFHKSICYQEAYENEDQGADHPELNGYPETKKAQS